jgi:hypothetical protein
MEVSGERHNPTAFPRWKSPWGHLVRFADLTATGMDVVTRRKLKLSVEIDPRFSGL